MSFIYIELFKEKDPSVLTGNIFKVFKDGETPPVPESDRFARIEIKDKTADEIYEMIKAGLGSFTLSGIENGAGVRNVVTKDRDLSAAFAQVEKHMEPDIDPAKIEGEKTFLERDLPGKPKGSLFVRNPNERVYRCATDMDTWFEPDRMSKISLPEKPLLKSFEESLNSIG